MAVLFVLGYFAVGCMVALIGVRYGLNKDRDMSEQEVVLCWIACWPFALALGLLVLLPSAIISLAKPKKEIK
jgi:hypothetical protein